MDFRVNYHTWFGFRKEFDTQKVRFRTSGNTNLTLVGCFDSFWNQYNSYYTAGDYFIFGWDTMPIYINEIIESFNSTFKHIQLILIDSMDVEYTSGNVFVPSVIKDNAKAIVLTMEIDKGYKDTSRKYLYYIVHHLLRLLSLCEDAYNKSGTTLTRDYVKNHKNRDFCELVSDINSYWLKQGYSYRGVEYAFTAENVKLLDDIELCNKTFDFFCQQTRKQTDILFSLFYNSPLFKPIDLNTALEMAKKSLMIKEWDNVGMFRGNKPVIGKFAGIYQMKDTTKDYSAQKYMFMCKSSIRDLFDLIIETDDCLSIAPQEYVYGLKNKTITVPSDKDLYIYNCMSCNNRISTIEHDVYFGLCRTCAKCDKYTISVCKKHLIRNCYNCKDERTKLTGLEREKVLLKNWGINKIVFL